MKEEINLLPPLTQSVRLRRLYFKKTGHFVRLAITLMILLFLVLGAAVLAINAQENIWRTWAPAGDGSEEAALVQLKDVNMKIKAIDAETKNATVWARLAAEVLQKLPEGVKVSEMNVDESTGQLLVKGTFVRRADIVAYEAALKQLPWVKNVQAPLSNYATSKEAQFSFTLSRR